MSLLKDIKDDLDGHRKHGNKTCVGVLTVLYSEAAMVGKNAGNRESTDEEVMVVAKKFIKGAKEMLAYFSKDKNNPEIKIYKDEIDIYSDYLPKQLTTSELTSIIENLIAEFLILYKKDIGTVMKALKERHDGTYDGKEASSIIKEILID